ncbi:MAG: hypothetical protein IJ199_00650 [Prevotella sp.]|nr:hypothetical protein [Prevotella sp.]
MMKKQLLLLTLLLGTTGAVSAAVAEPQGTLTVERQGFSPQGIDLAKVGRIDLTDASDIRVIGKDGTLLLSGLTTANLKLNLTDDVPSPVTDDEARGTLTVVRLGVPSQFFDLSTVGRIDLTDASDIRVLGTDGALLLSGLTTSSLRLSFVEEDVPTDVDTVEAADKADDSKAVTVRKRIVNGQLVIETADGVFSVAGQRIK